MGLLNVFDLGVCCGKCDLHPADFASVVMHSHPGRHDHGRSGVHHASLGAVIADVVRFADPKKGVVLAHGMRNEMSQRAPMSEA